MFLNKVFIIGNLTRDPEVRKLPSGTSVTTLGVATNRFWTNKEGQRQQDTQFHNVVAFGRQAETVAQYLRKGSSLLVEGRLQTRSWDAPDGTKRYRTEIVADRIQFGPKLSGAGAPAPAPAQEVAGEPPPDEAEAIKYPEEEAKPEDIPF